MHTFWHRAHAIFTFACTVLACLCICVTLTDFLKSAHTDVNATLISVEGLQRESNHDRAWLAVNLTADLREEFTWNTKQAFVWVAAEFSTPEHQVNQALVWSRIIQQKDNAYIQVPVMRHDYPYTLTDRSGHLRGQQFNLTVAWNLMPFVGAMRTHSKTFSGFTLPEKYKRPDLGRSRHQQF